MAFLIFYSFRFETSTKVMCSKEFKTYPSIGILQLLNDYFEEKWSDSRETFITSIFPYRNVSSWNIRLAHFGSVYGKNCTAAERAWIPQNICVTFWQCWIGWIPDEINYFYIKHHEQFLKYFHTFTWSKSKFIRRTN